MLDLRAGWSRSHETELQTSLIWCVGLIGFRDDNMGENPHGLKPAARYAEPGIV